jgi:hypothetical protein
MTASSGKIGGWYIGTHNIGSTQAAANGSKDEGIILGKSKGNSSTANGLHIYGSSMISTHNTSNFYLFDSSKIILSDSSKISLSGTGTELSMTAVLDSGSGAYEGFVFSPSKMTITPNAIIQIKNIGSTKYDDVIKNYDLDLDLFNASTGTYIKTTLAIRQGLIVAIYKNGTSVAT